MTDDTDSGPAVVIERSFDAPIDLVWKMWAHADHFSQWYGPDGASVPVAEMDVRPGGTRLVCMQMGTGEQAMQMWFTGEYREVDEPHRLVYTESVSDPNGNVMDPAAMGMPEDHPSTTVITVELDDVGGRTRMVMRHAGVPADSPGAMGWNVALDKLEARLSGAASE